MNGSERLFSRPFFLMCAFTFSVFLSLFQLLPTAPFRILELGGSTVAAGLFLGLLTYASALSAPFTGALADRFGRRRMLLVSSLVIAGFSTAYAFSKSWQLLVGLVFFHGFFWSGLLSASAAYITGLIPPERRAEGIGYWGMATVLATAFAPALGLEIYRHGWAALCASVGMLNLVMAAIAWRLPESEAPARAAGRPFFTRDFIEWPVLAVSMSLFLCSFGYGGVTSFVAMWTERSGISPKGLFFTVFSLTVLCLRPFVGRFADRVGPRRVILPLLGLVSVSFAVLSAATSGTLLAVSAVLFGVSFGNVYPVYVAHVTRHVDSARRGAAFGAILAAFDTGIGTGSVALGAVIGSAGFPAAYGTAAVLAAFSIPAFVLLERRFLGDGVREKLPV
ncbi:MAG TPA: MFS transporter [Thermoanaerobaculia bacterium]|nr:MFS transporter [Thermoanaerobaculia bacterium]